MEIHTAALFVTNHFSEVPNSLVIVFVMHVVRRNLETFDIVSG